MSMILNVNTDAFWVYFTEESRDICDEATGIASEEPSFTLNPTYDEERDVFKIDFTDSDPMTTMFKKTEVEDVELEIDNEGKLVTLLFHDASNKMSNISKTSVKSLNYTNCSEKFQKEAQIPGNSNLERSETPNEKKYFGGYPHVIVEGSEPQRYFIKDQYGMIVRAKNREVAEKLLGMGKL
ncbi:15575_t:CDS:2 [Entrophospora sp. SA101]|nr:15575_t:CDS:2 [Entrophospora sp. SA101]